MRYNRKHTNRLPEHLLVLIYNLAACFVMGVAIIVAIGIKTDLL